MFVTFDFSRSMWCYTGLDAFWRLLQIIAIQNLVLISFVLFRVRTEYEKILVLNPDSCVTAESIDDELSLLIQAAENYDGNAIRTILMRLVPEYLPADNQLISQQK